MSRAARKENIHPTHTLGEEHTEIRCPGSTPRFYGVRECKDCGAEMIEHPAGFFMDEELVWPYRK